MSEDAEPAIGGNGNPPEGNPPENDESFAELDHLYRQAVEAMDQAEWQVGFEIGDEEAASRSANRSASQSSSASRGCSARSDHFQEASCSRDEQERSASEEAEPREIVEAALFVGGMPLTAKKLCHLLDIDFDQEAIEAMIGSLNDFYRRQGRPYEIRLGEGGYRLELKGEFEAIRRRVYGQGPKEIKLSQEALEVLALVAYQQPISKQEIVECGKAKPDSILRGLLRRELIAIQRDEHDRKKVTYVTTDRFLQVFGLAGLEELPQGDRLNLK